MLPELNSPVDCTVCCNVSVHVQTTVSPILMIVVPITYIVNITYITYTDYSIISVPWFPKALDQDKFIVAAYICDINKNKNRTWNENILKITISIWLLIN